MCNFQHVNSRFSHQTPYLDWTTNSLFFFQIICLFIPINFATSLLPLDFPTTALVAAVARLMPGGEAAFGPSELGRHPHTEVRFGSFGMIFDLGRWKKLLIHVSLAHELNSINFEFQEENAIFETVLFVNFQIYSSLATTFPLII